MYQHDGIKEYSPLHPEIMTPSKNITPTLRPHQFNFLVHGFFHKKYGARGRNKNKNCIMVGVKVRANPKHKE